MMARRFPALSVTLKTADALAILAWAREKAAGSRRTEDNFPVRCVAEPGREKRKADNQ